MTLKNLKDIDKDELLRKIGLETKRSTGETLLSVLAIFGVGLVVGAGVGMLLAPKAGRELREDLRHRLQGATEGISETFADDGHSLSERPRAS
jgi:hypothetical protein